MPTLSDYYNRFTRSKGWLSVLFTKGNRVQLPELNEMQAVAHSNLQQVANTLFKDGSILQGLQPVVSGDEVILSAGKLYAYGYVIDVPQLTASIDSSAEEKVGIKLVETIVTEVQDTGLKDPVTGAPNFGRPGAHRLTYVPQLVINDPDAFTLHVLKFGEVVSQGLAPQFDQLNQTLALRTREESGSYLVDGMDTKIEDTKLDWVLLHRATQLDELADTIDLTRAGGEDDPTLAARVVAESVTVVTEAGVAYVEGFRVFKPSPTRILLPKSKTERFVNNQPLQLPGSHTPGTNVDLALPDAPVSRLGEVTAPIRHTISNQVRSGFTNQDFLSVPNDFPIIGNPVSVTYTGPGPTTYTYVLNTHFTFANKTITWLDPDNVDPNVTVPRGASYTVVVDINATLEVGDSGTPKDVYLLDSTTVRFTGKLNGSNITYKPTGDAVVDYYWYLNRADLVYVDKDGVISRILGQPDRTSVVPGTPANTLALASVSLTAGAGASGTTVTDLKLKRLTMADLKNLADRLERAEYNQAITNLNVSARLGVASGVSLKGIFTDAFTNVDKIDTNHADVTSAGVSFAFAEGEISTPVRRLFARPVFNLGASTNLSAGSLYVTSSGTPESARLNQTAASSTVKVNEYAAIAVTPVMTLIPSRDVVLPEENVIEVANTTNPNVGISLPTWMSGTAQVLQYQRAAAQKIVLGQTDRKMNSRTVTVEVTGLPAFADNLALTIDGVAVNTTPVAPTTAGTTPYNGKTTVKADSTGKVKCTFVIPANTIPSGIREVRLTNGTSTATTTYEASNPIVTVLSLLPSVTYYTPRDPVAQTFTFTGANGGDALVTGVKLYFHSKPAGADAPGKDVTVQIRETIGGVPVGNSFLATATLMPSQVTTSTNGATATTVTFTDAALCAKDREYSVVVLSDSTDYILYKATVGERTIGTDQLISSQAAQGVLLTSANGSTWTPDQRSDLKFELITSQVAANSTMAFDPIVFGQAVTSLQLTALQIEPQGSTVVWQFSLDNFATVAGTLDPSGTEAALPAPATTVYLRALIFNTVNTVSAMIDKNSVRLTGVYRDQVGKYVCKAITLQTAPTSISAQIDMKVPAGCSFTLEYGIQTTLGVITWTAMTQQPGSTPSEAAGFNTYSFASGAIVTSEKIVRLRLILNGAVSGPAVVAVPVGRRLVSTIA